VPHKRKANFARGKACASWCSGVVAAAVEGQDALELLSVSVRIGRNCGRTKGVLSKLGAFANPQASVCHSDLDAEQSQTWPCCHLARKCLHGALPSDSLHSICRCSCQRACSSMAEACSGVRADRHQGLTPVAWALASCKLCPQQQTSRCSYVELCCAAYSRVVGGTLQQAIAVLPGPMFVAAAASMWCQPLQSWSPHPCDAQEFRDVTEAHSTGAVAVAAAACTLSDAELRSPEQLAAAHGQLGGHLKKKVHQWHAYIRAKH
jgi:hypothetical protein